VFLLPAVTGALATGLAYFIWCLEIRTVHRGKKFLLLNKAQTKSPYLHEVMYRRHSYFWSFTLGHDSLFGL
jgi:hypothetical protein